MIRNKFLLLDNNYQFHLKEEQITLKGNVLKVLSTAICGTDLHILNEEIDIPHPIILGHEIIGIIEKLDNPDEIISYNKLSVGDVVILAPAFKCGECIKCKTGDYCINRNFYGLNIPYSGEFCGGFSQYINLQKNSKLYKLPQSMSIDKGLLVEVIAACIRANKIAFNKEYSVNKRVLVFGAGVIGITTAILAKLYGADVLICDMVEHRLQKASQLFNLNTLNTKGLSDVSITAGIKEYFKGLFPEIVIECAGTLKAIEQAFNVLSKRSRLVIMGNYADVGKINLSPSFICLNDIEIKGTSETYPEDMVDAMSIMKIYPEIQFDKMITHKFSLSDYEKAIEIAKTLKGIKVVFEFDK